MSAEYGRMEGDDDLYYDPPEKKKQRKKGGKKKSKKNKKRGKKKKKETGSDYSNPVVPKGKRIQHNQRLQNYFREG